MGASRHIFISDNICVKLRNGFFIHFVKTIFLKFCPSLLNRWQCKYIFKSIPHQETALQKKCSVYVSVWNEMLNKLTSLQYSNIYGTVFHRQERRQKLPDGGAQCPRRRGQLNFHILRISVIHKLDKYSRKWQKKSLLLNIYT